MVDFETIGVGVGLTVALSSILYGSYFLSKEEERAEEDVEEFLSGKSKEEQDELIRFGRFYERLSFYQKRHFDNRVEEYQQLED